MLGEGHQPAQEPRAHPVVAASVLVGTVVVLAGLWFVTRDERRADSAATVGGGAAQPGDRADGTTAGGTTSPPASPPGPPDQATLDGLQLRLEPVVEVQYPTSIIQHPASRDLYVTGLHGSITRVPAGGGDSEVVADVGGQISTSGESGLLDIAFDASGEVMFMSLVQSDGDLALVEVPFDGVRPVTEAPRVLLEIPSPGDVHHAGDIEVDGAGLLWYAVGDGGPSQGQSTRAQDLSVLRGKILRIDPRPAPGAAYQIPPGNPFAGRADARPEIWAYGLRNPWRIDLDPVTGDLWIGDVGRNEAEEVNRLPGPFAGPGANLGWPYLEGTTPGLSGAPADLTAPLLSYSHDGRCGVTGGRVYRGTAIVGLQGAYLYSDLCDGVVRAVSVSGDTVVAERAFDGVQAGYPVSFGADLDGEMYLCSFDLSTVYRLVPA